MVLVVSVQCLVIVSIIADLGVIRQVAGFLYLTFIPGMTLVRALKLKRESLLERVFISVGLSISFIMLLGYSTNTIGFSLGVKNPLSLASILLPLSIFVLVICAYIYLDERKFESEKHSVVSVEIKKTWPTAIVLLALPFISLLSCFFSAGYHNNVISLFLTLGISAIYLLTVVSARIVPPKLYPLVLFAIAFALLLQTTMISPYINGYDIHSEYYCFVMTKNDSFWNLGPTGFVRAFFVLTYSDMLSLTIFPLFYSTVLNLSGELIFKVIYPAIFSLVPVVLFFAFRELLEEKRAILAVFFFMAVSTFYVQMAYLARQMIAELLFALVLLLYAKNGFNLRSRAEVLVLFMFFFGILVSHYAMTYFLIFYVLCFLLVGLAKDHKLNMRGATHLLFLITLTFAWYAFASSPALLNDLGSVLSRITAGLNDIFGGGRDPYVLKALGVVSVNSLWREIGRYVFYAVEILIIVGFLKFLATRKRLGPNQIWFSGAVASMLILASSIVIPNFSTTLNISRIFQIALFFLAPLFVIGGETLFGLIRRMLRPWHKGLSLGRFQRICFATIALLIVFLFLFQSGFIFALVGDIPVSTSLTTDRRKALESLSLYDSYTFSDDVYGARWTLANISNQSLFICDQISAQNVLRSYGLVSGDRVRILTQDLKYVDRDAYIYLRSLNTINHIIEDEGITWILPENSSILVETNKIYSNGGCEIFKGTGP